MIRFNRIMIGYGAFSKRAWDNSASLRGRPHDGAASTRAASKIVHVRIVLEACFQ